MADGTNDTKDPIADLFSTRVARAGVLPQNSSSSTGAAKPVPSNLSSMAVRSKGGVAPSSGARGPVHSGSVKSSGAVRGKLSPLASVVLREARHELSSNFNLKNVEDGTQVIPEEKIAAAVDQVLKRRSETLDDMERANIIIHLQKDLMGWGVLQPLIDNQEVTDIHAYDHQTVVLQKGKVSEHTGLHWPNHQAYVSFIDRLLLRLGKSLSTQQHTVDASFPNGIRLCAVHESVCGARGPLLCIRVPRMQTVALENLVTYGVAPPLIVNYLAALTRSGHCTIIVAGETGTGKTTLMKCLGTQFGSDESIVAVEDTPELNFAHPFFRSLVSRPANTEGVGEVTLQEHIKTTLRMTPTRVILGEMRTPFAAEAFLESAQTGHTGMTTVHARNARETLVRLESLLGRAQKSVSIEIIRQQIALAVDCVIWLFREKGTGKPRIGEICEVGHYVEGAIQVRPMFTYLKQGGTPMWRVDSWSSQFDNILTENGIYLGDSPPEVGFNTVNPAHTSNTDSSRGGK